ncbi:MAG TPA: tRNA pseudouridine(38-40) synthase TruA [Gammaproteobacteria bacterium]|mgnify:CR=1 FL=1|nr:tRNA pseudouridine(38-40) synthase TruA [Gammaproteobacteria bacterium]MEC8010643.1 tRNA pseudouridine(38-40) synthase TruA [Pseudomonadota bacterium]HBF06620.1 tRNA pseudouridine(38-40) synthase TruA [Gammaproteobacteria bacterium]HCK93221.1 tRNA pseudouridine(38-40) synthase TruA [Gammaproteobacteria bacterium]|tara:strand:- start:609 stop:1454 length:846 start_codon:yes stop_codon:yes gene_type:complete
MKIAIGVEYLGTPFSGWQFQGHEKNTIQYYLQQALGFVANEDILIHASGRTDAGVNAMEQVCHFDTNVIRSDFSWRQGANTKLPKEIRIKWAQEAHEDFHSRYMALYRDYIYIIEQTPVVSALWRDQATPWRKPLNVAAMAEGVKHLIGEHDFSAYRAAGCQAKHPVRRLMEADVWQKGPFIGVAIRGNAFLHHMVRNIVGSLLVVGEGQKQPIWMKELLDGKDRNKAGATAPPQGLYLRTTHYAKRFNIPTTGSTPFVLFDDKIETWPKAYPDLDFGDRL